MRWKDWPYWLKGGIILLVIYVIFTVPLLLSYNQQTSKFNDNPISSILLIVNIMGGILLLLSGTISVFGDVTLKSIISLIVINSILYTLIGALIGWIYGKIKNKSFSKKLILIVFLVLGCLLSCLLIFFFFYVYIHP